MFADGLHLNLALVEQGLASAVIIPPNMDYSRELLVAQQQAKQQGLGIWNSAIYPLRPETEWRNADLDGWQRWTATFSQVKESKPFVRLTNQAGLELRIPRDNLGYFPAPQFYLNKPLEIRGWVSRQLDCCSILVRHPSVITVISSPDR